MMESLVIVSSPRMVLGCSSKPKDMVSGRYPFCLSHQFHRTTTSVSAFNPPNSNKGRAPVRLSKSNVLAKLGREGFASITSSNSRGTSSVGVNPPLIVPPPPSYFGSPLFWVGVGVGLSAVFSWVVSKLKQYAMQQTMKALNKQFNNAAFSSGSSSPWPTLSASGPDTSPFPTPPTSRPAPSTSPAISQSPVTVDTTAAEVEAPPATDVKDNTELKQPKKSAFVDISPEETLQKSPFGHFEDAIKVDSSTDAEVAGQVSHTVTASTPGFGASSEDSSSSRKASSPLSFEALERMMEDPTVQKMVYPYLPEEMRNPASFKWMMQNPQYRQQLEDMLNNMGGNSEWDDSMRDSLKDFDLSSPEVRQQFDELGLTPEEVITKIMTNPDIAMAFQNPRIQAAIMDCSQNPTSITKYQNDKEVMDVFNKISELFPGVSGSG